MIRVTKIFESRKEALDFIQEYLNRYHPVGYSTACYIYPRKSGDDAEIFEVRCTRGESCE